MACIVNGTKAGDLPMRSGFLSHGTVFDAACRTSHVDRMRQVEAGVGDSSWASTLPLGRSATQVSGIGIRRSRQRVWGSILRPANHPHARVQLDGALAARLGSGIGSVAGDSRQSNYVYGAAKAGAAVFLGALRNRLHSAGGRALTVKPGFLNTEVTYGLPGLFLVADPVLAGVIIAIDVELGRDVTYVPWFRCWIMLCTRINPERIFKQLRL